MNEEMTKKIDGYVTINHLITGKVEHATVNSHQEINEFVMSRLPQYTAAHFEAQRVGNQNLNAAILLTKDKKYALSIVVNENPAIATAPMSDAVEDNA